MRRLNLQRVLPRSPRTSRLSSTTTGSNPWRVYLHWTDAFPLRTAMATGAALWCFGDVMAQWVIERKERLHWGRLAGTVLYGLTVSGAMSLQWYSFLDAQVLARGFQPRTAAFVLAKLAPELCLWQPFTLCVFWMLVGLGEGKSLAAAAGELREGFADGMKVEWSIWAPTDSVNFFLVPVRLQVLVVNLACLVESTTLAYLHSQTAAHEASAHAASPDAVAAAATEMRKRAARLPKSSAPTS